MSWIGAKTEDAKELKKGEPLKGPSSLELAAIVSARGIAPANAVIEFLNTAECRFRTVVCFDPEAEPRYVRFYGEAELLETGALRDELRVRVNPIELAQDPDNSGVIVRIRIDDVVTGRTTHRA